MSSARRDEPAVELGFELDPAVEREVRASPEVAWLAWTRPEHISQWYAPAPGWIADCEIDLRPGGIFRTIMRSPDGEEGDNAACYLEVVEHERLVWTTNLLPGFRPPAGPQDLPFTAVISMESAGDSAGESVGKERTKYSALVMHPDPETCQRHDEMGFHDGWGEALNQLVELATTFR